MKARIEKKLSKRLVEIAPLLFRDAWVWNDEPTERAYKQGSRVSNIMCVGGDLDYWGEATDIYTVWEHLQMNYEWYGDFPDLPEGSGFAGLPDVRDFRATGPNLLRLAAKAESSSMKRWS